MAIATVPLSLERDVLAVFAEVTRYPLEILDPEANLEEDLGIDSVKLGEVFSVLRERHDLPQHMGLTPENLKNIRLISIALEQHLSERNGRNGHHQATTTPDPAPITATVDAAITQDAVPDDLLPGIQAVFAEVTRYPVEILDPKAQLEEDLGIDSVKLGEVFSVIREKYKLSDTLVVDPERLKTIAGIADAVSQVAVRTTVRTSLQPSAIAETNGHKTPNGLPGISAMPRAKRQFEGKVAFVSGSGRALGKDIAVYLAELGATVIVNSFHSRNQGDETVAQIKAAGGSALHAWGSVANPEHLDNIFNTIEAEFGALDFFISNASNGMLARLDQITPEHWEKAFRTNVVGLHQSALRAVNLMKKRGGGKIVTLSSPASHGYVDYFGCMGTVKAAVESLTKSMAIEFAPYNIQVNCVSPGPIYGELLNKWPESKRLIAEWEDATVTGRLCESRDVSHFVAYLLGDEVKLFTGSVLVMDGGISVRWG